MKDLKKKIKKELNKDSIFKNNINTIKEIKDKRIIINIKNEKMDINKNIICEYFILGILIDYENIKNFIWGDGLFIINNINKKIKLINDYYKKLDKYKTKEFKNIDYIEKMKFFIKNNYIIIKDNNSLSGFLNLCLYITKSIKYFYIDLGENIKGIYFITNIDKM